VADPLNFDPTSSPAAMRMNLTAARRFLLLGPAAIIILNGSYIVKVCATRHKSIPLSARIFRNLEIVAGRPECCVNHFVVG
jgi:hypothetical protein